MTRRHLVLIALSLASFVGTTRPARAAEESPFVLLGPRLVNAVSRVPASALASRFTLDRRVQMLVDETLERSPFFRRQWQRLALHPRLTLRLDVAGRSPIASTRAASTLSFLPDGKLLAEVSIPAGTDLVELIAHELEHILERLDGAHVAVRFADGDPTIRRTGRPAYETERAIHAGRTVAAEFAAARSLAAAR